MVEEIWKDIQGYEGLYQISNFGNVRSVDRAVFINNGNRGYYRHISGNTIKMQDNGHGYKIANLWKHNVGKKLYVHRLVAQAFIPNNENKEEVNHKDLNKANNAVSNLEWCTSEENMQHALKEYKTFCKGKEIMCVETGKIYKNSIIAEKETGILSASIRMNTCGKHKTAGGFRWEQL